MTWPTMTADLVILAIVMIVAAAVVFVIELAKEFDK